MSSDTAPGVLTPTAGRVLKRSLFWLGVVAFLAVIMLVVFGTAGSQLENDYLDPANAAPAGGRAVAEVLRQQGVEVITTTSLDETSGAIDDPRGTTLFVYDPGPYLDDEQLERAIGLADTVIFADAAFSELAVIAPELAQAGYVGGTLDADCEVPAVRKAGSVTSDDNGYRVVGDADGITACLGSGDDVYSLVQLDRGGARLTVLGASSALTNEHVDEAGNAALALNLLGENETLVWYLPSSADLPTGAPKDLGSLTPAWVTPALALLILTFIAGAIWRGRRFGPLVIEDLPVAVRASETMEGRARLYATASARTHALDSLRIGTLQRVGAMLGLPRVATVEEVVVAASGALGIDARHVRLLLLEAEPRNDNELIQLSDDLLKIERDIARSLRPERMGE